MRVLFFGTYDARWFPRVRVLQEGLAAHGLEVEECNTPLGFDTEQRVALLRRPWLLSQLGYRVGTAWWRLRRMARAVPAPDAVVVGYLGQFDVHLARRLWPSLPIALDHFVPAAETAVDRRVRSDLVVRGLERLDSAALRAADLVLVDTKEHRALVPAAFCERTVVVPVGVSRSELRPPRRNEGNALRVVFVGSYTPLQGTPVIGEAIALLRDEPGIDFTLVGRGQDYEQTRAWAAANERVRWVDWVPPGGLASFLAGFDVSLGIFGTSPKAARVVPNKVFQGAAAGCAVVTSDTPPQRAVLGEAAVFVPTGDAEALAEMLRALAGEPERVWSLRQAAYALAETRFAPEVVVEPLRERLEATLAPA
jgi:glycosyltransferase involved in cell wall biosynthesis